MASLYVDDKFKNSSFANPSDDVSPVLKQTKPGWSLAKLKYIYSAHLNGQSGIPYNFQSKIDTLRAYAFGQQDPNIYKPYFSADLGSQPELATSVDTTGSAQSKNNKGRKHFMDVDFESIFSPAPKYINNLIGRFSRIDYDITVKAVDSRSSGDREWKKWSVWAKSVSAPFLQEIDQARGIPAGTKEELPQTLEELSIYESLGRFKLAYEVAMEKCLQFTDELSDEPELQKRVVLDLITANVGGHIDEVGDDGLVRHKYIDPKDLIIQYSPRELFDKTEYFAYVKDFTVADLRNKLPHLTEQEIMTLARGYCGRYGNPSSLTERMSDVDDRYDYDAFHVPVLYGAWISTDSKYYTTRTKGDLKITGEELPDETGRVKIKNSETRKTKTQYLKTIYEGYWVIGTDYVFDFGRMTDVPFDMKTREVRLPIHVYKIKGKSIVELMIPMLDQCQMTYLRLQNAIAKAPPSGLKIDIGKLKNMTMGKVTWTPLDLIKLYTQTGHLLYNSSVTKGQFIPPGGGSGDPGKAVEELTGGIGTALTDAVQSFEMAFASLSELTGIDRASAVSAQDARTSAAATKIAAAGTSDTLYPILSAWANIKRTAAECAALRIQSRCSIEDSPYEPIIGLAGVMAIRQAASTPPIYYGIIMKAKPTDEERTEILSTATESLKAGLLTFSQYEFVAEALTRGGTLNETRAYIAFHEKQAREQAQTAGLQNQQMDTEKQAMLAQKKIEGELAVIDRQSQADILLARIETDEKIRFTKETAGFASQNPK